MNIVKQFDDRQLFEKQYQDLISDEDLETGYWRWGLGDDGELYCQCSDFEPPNEWFSFSEIGNIGFMSMKTICQIAKEFSHLLVWL
jgi:hypothetical protein